MAHTAPKVWTWHFQSVHQTENVQFNFWLSNCNRCRCYYQKYTKLAGSPNLRPRPNTNLITQLCRCAKCSRYCQVLLFSSIHHLKLLLRTLLAVFDLITFSTWEISGQQVCRSSLLSHSWAHLWIERFLNFLKLLVLEVYHIWLTLNTLLFQTINRTLSRVIRLLF